MKTFRLLISLLFAVFSGLAVFWINSSGKPGGEYSESYKEREKEKIDRLFAVPILLYHNIDGKGPFSVTSEQLREHFRLIRESGVDIVPLRDLVSRIESRTPYRRKSAVITFDDGYKSMYDKLLPIAKEFGYPMTLFVYIDFVHPTSKNLISWDEIRALERAGIDVESHTYSHADLTKILSSDSPDSFRKLFKEMYLSRRIISLETGNDCDFIAFPYGNYNSYLVNTARLAGYKRAFTTEYGMNPVTRDNFCLRRHHIKSNYSAKQIQLILNQSVP